jgi:prophage DNA circulation protein
MAWQDGLLQGSFRGVKFFVESASTTGGRRVNVIEYPERDDPGFEDVGKARKEFQMSLYVIGDDFINQREKLIKALDTKGAAELVHPWRGQFQVRATTWSSGDSQQEGRTARIDATFIEERVIKIATSPSTQANVFRKKKNLLEKLSAWFAVAGSMVRKPATFIDKATATMDKGLDVIHAAKNVTGAGPEFARSLRQLRGRLDAYALNFAVIGQDVMALVNVATDFEDPLNPISVATSADARRELVRMAKEMNAPLVPGSGAAGDPIQQMIGLAALSGELGTMAVVEFDSAEEAVQAEQDLVLKFDALLDAITPTDDLFMAIQDALSALHADIANRVADLPAIVEVTLPQQTDLLNFTMNQYGGLEQLPSIAAQNGIIHPGFVSTAQPVKVKTQ